MSNQDGKYKSGVTPNKVIAYLENKSGKSQLKVAKDLGVTQGTISNWVGEIDDFIKQSPQYAEIAPKLAEMIPGALGVYSKHLNNDGLPGNPDVTVATNILKMIGVFVEKSKTEHTHYNGDDALHSELEKLGYNADARADNEDDTE